MLLSEFPELPQCPDHGNWSADMIYAHKKISDACAHADILLAQDESEPLRLRIHEEKLANDCLPLLEAMETAEYGLIPKPWIEHAVACLARHVIELHNAAVVAKQMEQSNITQVEPISILHTGKPGRPRKVINAAWLREAASPKRNIALNHLANILGVHRLTLRNYMKCNNVVREFHKMSQRDLDVLVKVFKVHRPNAGVQYLVGFLRSYGVRVQRRRVITSMRKMDPLGHVLREKAAIRRRVYKIPRPNSLWHMDGHHKLILWGFVIHGFIDGFSRMITGLWTSTNNRATTVLDLFLRAISEYGTPSRVRGDRGGENLETAVWMIMRRGPNRASYMWGSSTRNTRIERLWVEVGMQFARSWRAFFLRLERLHHLDRSNSQHLWLLQYLFLDLLNKDCADFQQNWNSKPIHTREAQYRSPNDLFFLGQTVHGIYEDELENVHPDLINQYYGVHGHEVQRETFQLGAGHTPEEDEEPGFLEELVSHVASAQMNNIRHEPIDVPANDNPFPNLHSRRLFEDILAHIWNVGFVPAGMCVREEEWEDGTYFPYETLRVGKSRKEVIISLPNAVWRPRAELWAQGFEVLTHVLEMPGS